MAPHARTLRVEPLEDRLTPAVHAAYAVTQDWGTGFQGQVTLSNDGPAGAAFTDLRFDLASAVASVWDAKVVSHVGSRYAVTNAGWDAVIPAGGSVAFGFTAAKGASTAATAFVLNGVPLDGPVSPPPVTPSAPPVTPPVAPPVTPPSSGNSVTFSVTGDWGSGLTGEVKVTNLGTAPLAGWKVGFDFPGPITSIWNGSVVSHVGTRYVVAPAAWNATLAPGGSTTIGFGAAPGGVTATNLALVGGTNPANRAPVPVDDAATAQTGQPVAVAVLANDSDPDGDALSVTAHGNAGHGSVNVNANGTVTYTPAAGYAGADSFSYTVADGHGGTAVGTVRVSVAAPTPVPPTPPAAPSAWPAKVFAPYVDATAWPTYDFVASAQAGGGKFYTLAFVTAGPGNVPAWGGYGSYALTGTDFDLQMRARVNSLRALGGDVAVSFGGAAGQELAQVITSVPALAAAYRSVIQAYSLTHLDFDIEGAAVADTASIARRSQAIAMLQSEAAAAGKELSVRFTLPVLPTGLDANGVAVLSAAKQAGARVDVVNVMAMDYGDNAAPNPAGHMGDYAIQAATSLFNQLTTLYGGTTTEAQRWKMVGVTPMIGVNDVASEVFTPQAARQLEAWALAHNIGLLSMWSVNRDQPGGAGVPQTGLEFAGIFGPFTG